MLPMELYPGSIDGRFEYTPSVRPEMIETESGRMSAPNELESCSPAFENSGSFGGTLDTETWRSPSLPLRPFPKSPDLLLRSNIPRLERRGGVIALRLYHQQSVSGAYCRRRRSRADVAHWTPSVVSCFTPRVSAQLNGQDGRKKIFVADGSTLDLNAFFGGWCQVVRWVDDQESKLRMDDRSGRSLVCPADSFSFLDAG